MAKKIELFGVVGWDFDAQTLRDSLPKMGGDVVIALNSPGGFVFDGFEIFNILKEYPGNITVKVGYAMSAASYIMLAGDDIQVYENSVVMIHKAWNLIAGNSDYLKKEIQILDGIDRILAKEYSRRTGRTEEEILADMANDLWLMGSDEIIDANFADSLLEFEEDAPEDLIEKPEAMAKVQQAMNVCRREEKVREKAAAYVKDWKPQAVESAPHAAAPPVDPIEEPVIVDQNPAKAGKDVLEEGQNMGFNELMEQNPEAKKEFEDLQAENSAASEKKVKAERGRISQILDLSGGLTESAKIAIDNGMDYKDYAVEEMKNAKKSGTGADSQDLGGLEPQGQLPQDTAPTGNSVAERQKAAAKKFYKKDGKK